MDQQLIKVSLSLIPFFFSLFSVVDNIFIKAFIHDKTIRKDHSDEFRYLLCGQSFLISPISSLILVSGNLIAKLSSGGFVLYLTIYFVFYIFLLIKLVRAQPNVFVNFKQPYKFIYKYLPLIFSIVAIGFSFFK